MHVDGFRFDLAATLARELHEVDRLSAFFDLIQQDPVISQVKLIAEPWDVGEGGYQVGNFPPLWSEWNGQYRDTRARLLARARTRRSASSRYAPHRQLRPLRGDRPPAVREHQLRHRARRLHAADLVSYNEKHNEANGEENRDGDRRQPLVELRRRRADRRSRRAGAARAASSATSSPRCSCRRACRCCSAATRSAARSTATTTPTARTTRSRGSTGRTSTKSCCMFTRG